MRLLENKQSPLPESAAIACDIGMAPAQFVRLFTAQLGVSPQEYGRSLAMMNAASRLRYSSDPVEVVAHDFGYAKQATFTKAFTRLHGMPPARWRRIAQAEDAPISEQIRPEQMRPVRLERLPSRSCIARRYFGPRQLGVAFWGDFNRRLPAKLHAQDRFGLAYDDPRVTPPERIRYDCCAAVEDDFVLSRELADDGLELLRTPEGRWAIVDVPASAVASGYRTILDGWLPRRRGYALEGDPFLEQRTSGSSDVSVCIRVRLAGENGSWNMVVN